METNRLLLRPWREEDDVELQRLFNDPAVRDGRNLPPDRIARLAEGSLRQWRVNGFGPWAAIDKTTGSWIGRVGLDELDDWPGVDKIEVGFELHKAWWGRGLATESALAALEFGFEQHGLQCIISVTAAAHAAARRVMEKAGLTYRGTRYWMNPEVPVVWYAIDRAAWKASKSEANTRCDDVPPPNLSLEPSVLPHRGSSWPLDGNMMGVRGFNALQIVLASGFPHLTDLGDIPADVERLASLPEPVSLVRADESVNFKLAANASDPIRSDTAIYPGLVRAIPGAVTAPDYFLVGSKPGTFQLIKRVAPPERHPSLVFIRLAIKFVSSSSSKSGTPELWLSTVVLHSEASVAPYLRRGIRIAA